MKISGSITALATPFKQNGEIDFDAWKQLLHAQYAAGSDGVVVAGSTGEAAALYKPEYDSILRKAVEILGGKIPVIAGTGQSNTAKTISHTRRAGAMGADAALVVVPPYVRATQSGIEAHFRAIADDGALPLIMYNIPARTGSDMLPDTVAKLCTHPRIIGIKEADVHPERMQALLKLKNEQFQILSGDDPTALRAMLAGADGVISVASNVIPSTFKLLCTLARQKMAKDAEALDARLRDLYTFLGVEPNPIPVKALLTQLGYGVSLRLPLQTLDNQYFEQAMTCMRLISELEPLSRGKLPS